MKSLATTALHLILPGVACPLIVAQIAAKFPAVKIVYDYSDEDFGCNVGTYIFEGGECINKTIYENESKEAYEKAF